MGKSIKLKSLDELPKRQDMIDALYSCHWLEHLVIPEYLPLTLSTFKLPSVQVWSPAVGLLRKTCILRFLSFDLKYAAF